MSRKMKDSGIEWIGKIPDDWKISKLKYMYDLTIAGEVIDKSFWNSGDELLYTCQKDPMESNFINFPNRKRTGKNDLLLTRNATPYIFIPENNSIYSNVVQKITLNKNFNVRFIRYALLCGVNTLTVNGDTIPSWNMNVWNNINIPLLKKDKQENIANYLDKKVSKIDETIENNKRSIELLEEYKKSVINKSVISKNNWKKEKIKYFFSSRKGLSITKDNLVGKGIAVISYGQIHSKKNNGISISNDLLRYVPENYLQDNNNCLVKTNDFIFADTSEDIEGVGNNIYIDYKNDLFAGYHTIILSPKKKTNTKFFAYLFKSDIWRSQLRKNVSGIKVFSITQRMLNECIINIPPYIEQKNIVNKLDNVIKIIDTVINYRQQIIEKLEEYKKSLIYEVVTGKKEV